jgi:hypothetical protein
LSLNMVNYCCKTFVDTTRQKNDFMIFNIKYAMKEKTLLFPVEFTFLLIRGGGTRTPHGAPYIANREITMFCVAL